MRRIWYLSSWEG